MLGAKHDRNLFQQEWVTERELEHGVVDDRRNYARTDKIKFAVSAAMCRAELKRRADLLALEVA